MSTFGSGSRYLHAAMFTLLLLILSGWSAALSCAARTN